MRVKLNTSKIRDWNAGLTKHFQNFSTNDQAQTLRVETWRKMNCRCVSRTQTDRSYSIVDSWLPGPHFSTWLPRCSKLTKLPIRKNFTWAYWSSSTLHEGPLLDSKNARGGYTTFDSPHKDINFQMARLSHSRTAGFAWVFDTSPVHKGVAPLPADTVDTLTPECSSSSQGWSTVLIRRCFWPVLWLCDNLVTLSPFLWS